MTDSRNSSYASKLAVSAMLIAISTVLSLIKLAELPYGGSVTVASLLPIVIIAYRYGTPWGALCGFVHGALQLILGMNVLSWVTGWQSTLAVILLDYLVAFALVGAVGFTRKIMKTQTAAIVSASVLGALFRYACHFVSGVTVWRDISIPSDQAIKYSLIYNATYMIPETIVLVVVAFFISSALDFSQVKLTVAKKVKGKIPVWNIVAGAVCTASAAYTVAEIFTVLQNADTGEFDVTGIAGAHWVRIGVVIVIAAASVLVAFLMRKKND